jgi:hypothetical protein
MKHLKICEIPFSEGKYSRSRGEAKKFVGSVAGTNLGH